jgi:hypothetical protein
VEPTSLPAFAAVPWALHPAWFALLALVPPALAWVVCAWRSAYASDPNARRRAGVRELQRLLKRLQRSRSAPRPEHLHAWRRAVARAWDVPKSAPTAAEIARAQLALSGDEAGTNDASALWHATERALFGAEAALPADWLPRACALAASMRMPERTRRFPNRLRDWRPAVAAGLVGAFVVAAGLVDPARAEISRATVVAAAERLTVRWNDPAAHHTLALAHAERENWNSALVHAVAAFAQAPTDATRSSLRAALEHNEVAARELLPLVAGPWYASVPSLASPASWQRGALASAAGAAVLLTLLVVSVYVTAPAAAKLARRWHLRWILPAAAVVAVLGLGGCVAAWQSYGLLREPGAAVILQSTNLAAAPTDLVPEEETSPVVAGALVRQRSAFLGWRRVETSSGAAGWVRREAVRAVYGSVAGNAG